MEQKIGGAKIDVVALRIVVCRLLIYRIARRSR
jgi:hypothetical protein